MLDLRIGIGHCFLQDDRACTEGCMAFSRSHAETGEHPCRIMSVAQEFLIPKMEQTDLRTQAIENHAGSVYALADALNNLAATLQAKGTDHE